MDKRLLDKKWRMSHLYSIKDKDQNKVQFTPNRAQTDFRKNRHTRNIILKSRQLGFTTYEALESLDDCLFNKNFNALMINYEQQLAISVFKEKISFAWENLLEPLRNMYSVDTKRANQFTFDFGDASYSTIACRASGKSGTYHKVHISEFAKMCRAYPQNAMEVIEGTIPSVPMDGVVDIESTAEGSDGIFYEMFWDAWNRSGKPLKTEYKAHFYNWTWDDAELSKIKVPIPFDQMDQGEIFKEYQKKYDLTDIQITYYYLKWLASNKKWNLMRQNYPTTPEEAFVGSGYKMFDTDQLELLRHTLKEGKKHEDWTFYEPYIDTHHYCMGVDVAEGVGQDSSVIIILDVTEEKARVVAEYASNQIPPDLLAYEVKWGGEKYGNAIAGVERNSTGHTVLTILKGIYENIYTEVTENKVSDVMTEKLGWWTNQYTKPKMMYALVDAIRDSLIDISSKALFEELRTYDKEDIRTCKFNSVQSRHWDRVMAFAIAWQMRSFAYDTSEMEIFSL